MLLVLTASRGTVRQEMMSLGRGDEGAERTVWVCGDLHKRNAYKSNLEKLAGAIYPDSHWFKFHLLYFPEKARKK